MKLIRLIIVVSILFSCASQPLTFIESKNEEGMWKSIPLHSRYGMFVNKNKEVWRRVVDILSEKYDLEILDKTSGYIRTSWKSLPSDDKKYRSRVIIKMLGNVWHTARLKTEAQLLDGETWLVGYDKVILEEIYKDLQGRVGTSVR
ncbi:hypothetical protein QUF74_02460 [Candidatus Halobeggiatoa sp. HSG11]|nr:hypothetical protein [Candidatus Halobeggiatoa sp. HSG11]